MRALFRVALASVLVSLPATAAEAAKATGAPPAIQAEFDGFIAKFRAALKANDSAAVAAMSALPFTADEVYSDAAQFRAKLYPHYFTRKFRNCIRHEKALYARDGDNNDTYAIFCFDNIFNFTRKPAGFLLTDIGLND